VTVFAKNGFQDLVNKIRLGKFLVRRWVPSELQELSPPVRFRRSLEELGPTFVKLGQLLASRPDLVPEELCLELQRLHDRVEPVDFSAIRRVIEDEFDGTLEEVFPQFEEQPLASASIAQVHRAVLEGGQKVVVKVQRPGIEKIIAEDLGVLTQIAALLDRYVPEARVYNPRALVKEFGRSLELETNFIIEANNIKRFRHNFAGDETVVIPEVFSDFSGKRVLVMEALQGKPLSAADALDQPGVDALQVLRLGVRAYLKMVYTHGFFHGDLHAGNLFIFPDNRIGLIDFGVVGRLTRRTRSAIASMFLALAEEDFERMAYVYVDLAPYNEHVDVDGFAQDLAYVLGPYVGLTMKHINLGQLLMESTSLAAKHGLVLPAELMLFFKSIVAIEGVGRRISEDFDFMGESLTYSRHLIQSGVDAKKLTSDFGLFVRDMNQFLYAFPRQLRQTFRRINNPAFAVRTEEQNLQLIEGAIDRGFRRLYVLIVLIAAAFGLLWWYLGSN
jgi:ubiquinone biosynthesis protein